MRNKVRTVPKPSGPRCLCVLWSPATGLPGAASRRSRSTDPANSHRRRRHHHCHFIYDRQFSLAAILLPPAIAYPRLAMWDARTAALIISAAADGHLTPPLVNNALSSSSAALLPLPVPLISGCSILLASASSSLFAAVCFKRSANFYSYLAIKYVQRHVFELNPAVFSKLLVCNLFFAVCNLSLQFAKILKNIRHHLHTYIIWRNNSFYL